MEDLLKPQIFESCKIAVPDGLKDLMSDISREVLRAQPRDILKFITNYLSCLLVTRENLTVANEVYKAISCNICLDGIEDELRFINIKEEDVQTISELMTKYFNSSKKPFKEGELISKILRKTSITENLIPNIQQAMRNTFLRQGMENIVEELESTSIDDVTRAVNHTLHIYKNTGPSETSYQRAAARIQAAYKAYKLRREKPENKTYEWKYEPDTISKEESFSSEGSFKGKRFRFDEIELMNANYDSQTAFDSQKFQESEFYARSKEHDSTSTAEYESSENSTPEEIREINYELTNRSDSSETLIDNKQSLRSIPHDVIVEFSDIPEIIVTDTENVPEEGQIAEEVNGEVINETEVVADAVSQDDEPDDLDENLHDELENLSESLSKVQYD